MSEDIISFLDQYDNSIGQWLRESLVKNFENPEYSGQFIAEKKELMRGKLYQYCPIEHNSQVQYSIENLKESILYLSRLSDFNDPFDSNVRLSMTAFMQHFLPTILDNSIDYITDDLKKLITFSLCSPKKEMLRKLASIKYITQDTELTEIQKILRKYPHGILDKLKPFTALLEFHKPQWNEALVKMKKEIIDDQFLITCFSENFDNALMWAHYSRKHKGFCVEYDLNRTKNFELLIFLQPVIYSKNRATISPNMFNILESGELEISKSSESSVDLLCAFLTKSDVWEYEKEWRLVFTNKNDVKGLKDRKFSVDCIEKVIMGCRIEDQNETLLREICKSKGIHLSKMRLDENDYQLNEIAIF